MSERRERRVGGSEVDEECRRLERVWEGTGKSGDNFEWAASLLATQVVREAERLG